MFKKTLVKEQEVKAKTFTVTMPAGTAMVAPIVKSAFQKEAYKNWESKSEDGAMATTRIGPKYFPKMPRYCELAKPRRSGNQYDLEIEDCIKRLRLEHSRPSKELFPPHEPLRSYYDLNDEKRALALQQGFNAPKRNPIDNAQILTWNALTSLGRKVPVNVPESRSRLRLLGFGSPKCQPLVKPYLTRTVIEDIGIQLHDIKIDDIYINTKANFGPKRKVIRPTEQIIEKKTPIASSRNIRPNIKKMGVKNSPKPKPNNALPKSSGYNKSVSRKAVGHLKVNKKGRPMLSKNMTPKLPQLVNEKIVMRVAEDFPRVNLIQDEDLANDVYVSDSSLTTTSTSSCTSVATVIQPCSKSQLDSKPEEKKNLRVHFSDSPVYREYYRPSSDEESELETRINRIPCRYTSLYQAKPTRQEPSPVAAEESSMTTIEILNKKYKELCRELQGMPISDPEPVKLPKTNPEPKMRHVTKPSPSITKEEASFRKLAY